MGGEDGAAGAFSTLVRWAGERARDGLAGLPPHVVAKAAAVLVDDTAAMCAAAREKEVRALAGVALRRRGPREATLLAAPAARAERSWAAMGNAVAANWHELEGGYRRAACHAGLYVIPAALAELEAVNGSLEDLIVGVTLGYEITARVALAFASDGPLVVHPHAGISPLGAAATLALLRGMDADAAAGTIAAAATMAMAGPFSHARDGVTIRNAWAGTGAKLGFLAADLAGTGLTAGPGSVAEAYRLLYRRDPDPAALTGGLGSRFAIEDGYHKRYACCQYTHSAAEAAITMRSRCLSGLGPDEIASVRVETHPRAMELDGQTPRNPLAARFSLPHVVAAALATGTASPEAFSDGALGDPAIERLRRRVTLHPYRPPREPPFDRPARLTVTTLGGRTFTTEVLSAAGGPDRPLPGEALLAKVRELTAGRSPRFHATAADLLAGRIGYRTPVRRFLAGLLDPAGKGPAHPVREPQAKRGPR